MDLAALSTSQFASLLGVDDSTVRIWIRNNNLPATKSGRGNVIEWRSGHNWWLAYREAVNGNGGNRAKNHLASSPNHATESYEDALARKTRAEADLKELQLANERRQVVSIGAISRVLTASVVATQAQILAVPSRLAMRMLGLEDYGMAVAVLDAEMRQLLTNLATIDAVREAGNLEPEGSEANG